MPAACVSSLAEVKLRFEVSAAEPGPDTFQSAASPAMPTPSICLSTLSVIAVPGWMSTTPDTGAAGLTGVSVTLPAATADCVQAALATSRIVNAPQRRSLAINATGVRTADASK